MLSASKFNDGSFKKEKQWTIRPNLRSDVDRLAVEQEGVGGQQRRPSVISGGSARYDENSDTLPFQVEQRQRVVVHRHADDGLLRRQSRRHRLCRQVDRQQTPGDHLDKRNEDFCNQDDVDGRVFDVHLRNESLAAVFGSGLRRLVRGDQRPVRLARPQQLAPLLFDVAALRAGEHERKAGLEMSRTLQDQ